MNWKIFIWMRPWRGLGIGLERQRKFTRNISKDNRCPAKIGTENLFHVLGSNIDWTPVILTILSCSVKIGEEQWKGGRRGKREIKVKIYQKRKEKFKLEGANVEEDKTNKEKTPWL
jgi:hypothetical protein